MQYLFGCFENETLEDAAFTGNVREYMQIKRIMWYIEYSEKRRVSWTNITVPFIMYLWIGCEKATTELDCFLPEGSDTLTPSYETVMSTLFFLSFRLLHSDLIRLMDATISILELGLSTLPLPMS